VVLRGAFYLQSRQDVEEGLAMPRTRTVAVREEISLPGDANAEGAEEPPNQSAFRVRTPRAADVSLSTEAAE
jgi:hypothetical protein